MPRSALSTLRDTISFTPSPVVHTGVHSEPSSPRTIPLLYRHGEMIRHLRECHRLSMTPCCSLLASTRSAHWRSGPPVSPGDPRGSLRPADAGLYHSRHSACSAIGSSVLGALDPLSVIFVCVSILLDRNTACKAHEGARSMAVLGGSQVRRRKAADLRRPCAGDCFMHRLLCMRGWGPQGRD